MQTFSIKHLNTILVKVFKLLLVVIKASILTLISLNNFLLFERISYNLNIYS